MGFSAMNGIPIVDASWPVANGFLFQDPAIVAKGHANDRSHYWHYHSSQVRNGGEYPPPTQLVGYAMDGFGIYGPLEDSSVLDECNGMFDENNGQYQYHMRRMDEIDFSLPQCNEEDNRVHNWKPVLGCFRGSTANSRVWVDNGNRDGLTCQLVFDGHYESPEAIQEEEFAGCLEAIQGGVTVAAGSDGINVATMPTTAAAQCHNSARTDRFFAPKAVIKVFNAEQVSAAVQCAAQHDVKVTPRSGAHGFENEACSGELIIDVSGLESLEVVDEDSKIVKFGAGHLHGLLYKKLSEQYGWVTPGGTENSVGTAGLWLGCGRGPLSQVHGLSCDNILGVEFVDAQGNIRNADSEQNVDMYWMARGSGGEFPGIVTSFTVQAYDQPTEVWSINNGFQPSMVPALVKAWSQRLEDLSDPSRKMFTAITSYDGILAMSMTCFSCSEDQKSYMKTQFDEITELAGKAREVDYVYWQGSWMDRLLVEVWDAYKTVEDLAIKPEWPEVWNITSNGGHLVYSDEEVNEAMLSVMQNALETHGTEFFFFLYSMIPSSSSTLMDTPYGGRDAKWIVHYKWIGTDANIAKGNLRELSIAFDEAGLQCKNFYNYANREYPCAGDSGEAWLEAHFSDVSRMRQIREEEDPKGLFVSNFKMQKWDTNKHIFLGFPEVGDWGGTCKCPNGSVYQVGDNNDGCASLACVGGTAGACTGNNPGGAGFKVVCDKSFVTPAPTTAPPVPTPFATPADNPVAAPTSPTANVSDIPSAPVSGVTIVGPAAGGVVTASAPVAVGSNLTTNAPVGKTDAPALAPAAIEESNQPQLFATSNPSTPGPMSVSFPIFEDDMEGIAAFEGESSSTLSSRLGTAVKILSATAYLCLGL
jgi:FAD/FMN-containing dehydrogenase